eukprot:CAMPEP_0184490176 /NCGR_PEP_ID=MMETSP0113_2-20130426/17219_1 /TAXON_ID=91329 /ORGANISM="Norrisiella sphaerica, Strain BC52" /LENGTH=33 /DNA_ID= /DNA_START= /DNA_END= /DNA_ORIENTATION=
MHTFEDSGSTCGEDEGFCADEVPEDEDSQGDDG